MVVRKTDGTPADAGRAREARTAAPSERRPEFRTTSDIALKRLYTPDDIASLEDMETLLSGIPLDRVTTSMTINATGVILLCLYLAVAEKQGVPWTKVGGTIQNDVLKEYAARGTYIYPPAASLRIVTDVFAFCTEHVPSWNTIS